MALNTLDPLFVIFQSRARWAEQDETGPGGELVIIWTAQVEPGDLDDAVGRVAHLFQTRVDKLGQMRVDDEGFRANYGRIAEGLAAYMRDAMTAYAHARSS
ncbi:TipAS antibiotic-recognition domain-containing protein [Streptosporangium sp. G11]|uniref:TipAS antibiotic-recognition domain-containing protein n=1 Tax=Streptosporangium sp. G11 TaxID=3436926 RepID=UPI003EC02B75